MMVGDDEVEAEPARGFSFSKGAHAGVDGDDQRARLRRGPPQARSIACRSRRAGDAEHGSATCAAEHFNGGFEQDDGNGAVDVVVAVEEDGLARGDGALDAARRPQPCRA